ncbi:MAG: bifunctional diguanylate cyclase/phosphodiesterase [Gammaproteobacteria bacterium]|nr:bifunctional diguanylate cyclase/phosphodiesterase [Gammaproteobacteria bacterium]
MKQRLPTIIAKLLVAPGLVFIVGWSCTQYFSVSENFWSAWLQQILPVILLTLLALGLVLWQLNRHFIKPLLNHVEKMAKLAKHQYGDRLIELDRDSIGIEHLQLYFSAIEKILEHDSSTGLNNRAIFDDRLSQAVSDGKRSGRKYALVLVEVEGVAKIIKKHGQYIADALFRQIAERISEGLRATDSVSQFDENLFAILLEVQDQDQLVGLVEKIYLKLSKKYQIFKRHYDISIVLGISFYPGQAKSSEQLFNFANQALENTKGLSWPIEFYDDGSKTDLSGYTLIQSLRQALDNDEFKLVFQPVIDLKKQHTVYLEALLRWKNPDMHDVSIERTILLAEKNQLIQPLTNWIVLSACELLSRLNISNMVIGINLSMVDLHDHYLPKRISKCLNKYNIKPGQILIEITESQIMQDPDDVAEILSHLGMMGLPLSIDDFGTGQASLTYLKKLPVEKLKIDQSFIRDILDNPDDKLIVKATIELAHTLDLEVIAEGVESAEIEGLLRELNCDYVQGYYISRPLEVDQIPTWYQQYGNAGRKANSN